MCAISLFLMANSTHLCDILRVGRIYKLGCIVVDSGDDHLHIGWLVTLSTNWTLLNKPIDGQRHRARDRHTQTETIKAQTDRDRDGEKHRQKQRHTEKKKTTLISWQTDDMTNALTGIQI